MSEIFANGGPAFPAPGYELRQKEGSFCHLEGKNLHVGAPAPGMSLRDWLAGQALSALLTRDGYKNKLPSATAEWCYKIADAMLAEREKQP